MGPGIDADSEDIASQVLVFMLTCINMAWKIPIGYFAINGLSAELKARLVQTALELYHEVNVKVVGLTFDGCESNLAISKFMDCDCEQH